MIIDGKQIAAEITDRTRQRVLALGRSVRLRAVVANPTPETESYLRIKAAQAKKAGIEMAVSDLKPGMTTLALAAAVRAAAADADALIVQLPLPEGVDLKPVLDMIPIEKDADVLSSAARARFARAGFLKPDPLVPPVVGAVQEIFERAGVDPKGKKAVVIGAGWLVGAPVAQWLEAQGAQVTTLIKGSERFGETVMNADIVVSGAGQPGLLTRSSLKAGAVLIDAGTSESGGAIVGDADPACAEIASVFTPVPGGVGPIAVAKLFENAVALAERARKNTA
jgi:methylenetetrahydrofolate dehydrogenase (NADP+)/methenyltetrahydrofolate cyclohydrolase